MRAYLVFSLHDFSGARLDSVNLQWFKIAGSENTGAAGSSIMIDAIGSIRDPVFAKIPSLRPLASRSDPGSEIATTLGARAISDAVIVDDIPVAEGRTERRTRMDVSVIPSDNPLAQALDQQRLGFSVAIPVTAMESSLGISSQSVLAVRLNFQWTEHD